MSVHELLPCPFCNGPAEMCDRDLNDRPFWAVCRACDVAGPRGASLPDAAAAWNRRYSQCPTGWKLVPVEPTFDMKIAGDHAGWWCGDKYRAMIEAAPAVHAEATDSKETTTPRAEGPEGRTEK